MRNEIEQRTQIEIRTQNLDAQRKSLDIEREGEYARLAQEHDIELRRTAQRVELAKDRAIRDQESEQAQIAAREEVEKVAIRSGAQPGRGAHPEPGRHPAARNRAPPR